MSTIEADIKDLFANNLVNVVAGLDNAFLVDLDTSEVVVAFPEAESKDKKFIAEIVATTTVQIEEKSKSMRKEDATISLTSMELRTEEGQRMATYRITNSWLICLVGKEDVFRPAFAKRLCEGPIKDQINQLLIKYNIAG